MKTAAKEWELAGMHNETDLDKSGAAIRMVQMRSNEDQSEVVTLVKRKLGENEIPH